jgi:hypothetical protein
MPHVYLPHVSTPTIFHTVAWLLVLAVVVELSAAFVVLMLGDPRRSPLDRWATWVARRLKDDDGMPLVRPGKEPTTGQKVGAAACFVVTIGFMVFFVVNFLGVG